MVSSWPNVWTRYRCVSPLSEGRIDEILAEIPTPIANNPIEVFLRCSLFHLIVLIICNYDVYGKIRWGVMYYNICIQVGSWLKGWWQ